MHFGRIGLAIAFSPRAEALLAEAARLKSLFGAHLTLIHVGEQAEENEYILTKLLSRQGLSREDVHVDWRKGTPSSEILKACTEHQIDLLITGALKKEGLVQHYIGSVARRILRQSTCSVLTIVRPGLSPRPFETIVVSAAENASAIHTLACACWLAKAEHVQLLQVVRETKLFGLGMTSATQSTEEEYNDLKQGLVETEVESVKRMLGKIPHDGLNINIRILAGKSGFEIAEFARRKQADLLVVGAPPRRLSILDHFFPHDVEYIFADLPCNLLVVRPKEESAKRSGHA